jgi:hypothetical protein
MVTRVRSGRTSFFSPNWTSEISLLQRVHSGCWVTHSVQCVVVVISAVKYRTWTLTADLNLVPSLRLRGGITPLRNLQSGYLFYCSNESYWHSPVPDSISERLFSSSSSD